MFHDWDALNRVGRKKTLMWTTCPWKSVNLHCQGQGWSSPLCWSSPRSQGPPLHALFACLSPAEASARLLHWEPHVWSQKPHHQPVGKQRDNNSLVLLLQRTWKSCWFATRQQVLFLPGKRAISSLQRVILPRMGFSTTSICQHIQAPLP